MPFNQTRSSVLALGLITAMQAACATSPEVCQQQDQGVDLPSYKTFAFFEPSATDGTPYTTLLGAQLRQATRSALEKQHYVYSETDSDLRVSVFTMRVERTDLHSTPVELGSYGASRVDFVDDRRGILMVDLVDAARRALVWRGVAQGRFDAESMKNPRVAFETAVTAIFAQYPTASMNRARTLP